MAFLRCTIGRDRITMFALSLVYFNHYPRTLLDYIIHSLKCLIQPLAQTWQQSVTSAAAEQLPTGLSAPMNHLVKSRDDISLMESGDVAAWSMELFVCTQSTM